MAVLSVLSCSDESDSLNLQELQRGTQSTKIRTLGEAIQIAQNATNMFATTRGGSDNSRTVDMNNIEYVTNRTTRSDGSQDTLLYVINYENEQGFCVVSANNNTEGLLAVTDQGEYDTEFAASDENGGFKIFMSMAEQYVRTAEPASSNFDPGTLYEFTRRYDTIRTITISPKVTVRWGQSGVEGAYASNGIAGCSNIAMAQIMSYFAYPSNIAITYTDSLSTLALNWTDINKHVGEHNVFLCAASDATHQTIGHFIRELGKLNDSDYKKDVTSTYYRDVLRTFQQLGYTVSNLTNYDGGLFTTYLNSNKLIYMRGDCIDDDGDLVGHAWVVDGECQYDVHITEWKRAWGDTEWTFVRDGGWITTSYMHINWGWDGDSNGYFAANVFETANGDFDFTGYPHENSQDCTFDQMLRYFTVTH